MNVKYSKRKIYLVSTLVLVSLFIMGVTGASAMGLSQTNPDLEVPDIFGVVQLLSGSLLDLTIIAIALVQFIKEQAGIKDGTVQVVSLVVGFVFSLFVSLSFLESLGWSATLPQWFGMVIFQIVGTIGPSGGYKTLRSVLSPSKA